jgi:predicted lipid-binding transport protein (Tim44 family)
MDMKKIVTFLSIVLLGLGLALQPVEAKRLGGGMSSGQQKQGFAREATPPSSSTANRSAAPNAAQAAPSGLSKWMGPLAGLAAGGLLAAMFFGGAFNGLQPMDFILIALLAFGAFMLFRALRNKSAQPHAAGSNYQYAAANQPTGANLAKNQASQASSDYSAAHNPLHDAPEWFSEDGFLQNARSHFLTLQMAWDDNKLDTLREYFTREMYDHLHAQRAEIGEASNITDVQNLDAQLLDLVREGDKITASVLFQGRIRENNDIAEDFAEIWHVQHRADSAQGDWLISGIQQTEMVKH